MNFIKKAIWGPTSEEQRRTCAALIRKNQRAIDSQIQSLNSAEIKTVATVKHAARRNDVKSARLLSKEIYNLRKHRNRLHQSKAQLNSVGLQVNEAFAMKKIEGSMKSSADIMKQVNSLIKLPELMGTMQGLSQELMKSGIINDMMGDAIDDLGETDYLEIDDEAEAHVANILTEIIGDKFQSIPADNATTIHSQPEALVESKVGAEPEENDPILNIMKDRLRALES
ncbi:doa4-independent degradation protein 3 [Nadsonia fulvescens var. elongata DSM 6958]|uniref:Doa4-independent degradation protein 3 n=1 Tax=Nadsonia fulvescens var. elongata DSM 6958 TaxID=857566 RepID=A0A1E3PQJ3_9ASCO|nr:doa4-independent degradation protein 3 [Nadsonia fulvescens var. elongata DSM 6958]